MVVSTPLISSARMHGLQCRRSDAVLAYTSGSVLGSPRALRLKPPTAVKRLQHACVPRAAAQVQEFQTSDGSPFRVNPRLSRLEDFMLVGFWSLGKHSLRV